MPSLTVITRDGRESTVQSESGQSLMEAIRAHSFSELLALCGGSCACSTCHVFVDPAFLQELPPLHSDEDDLLDSSEHRRPNSRLACQVSFGPELDGIRLQIAPEN